MAAILCYVTDRKALASPDAASLLTVERRAIAAGINWIQIREKDLPARALAALAREAVAAARGSATRILINGRLDVALAACAGGVHLGGDALPLAEVAAWCAKNVPQFAAAPRDDQDAGLKAGAAAFLLGASCHSLAEAQAAERDGAHYIIFGPVYSTPSKIQFGAPQGLARLKEVCRAVKIPVLAIGGITLGNAHECLHAGAAGIAAIRLFQESADFEKVVTGLRQALSSQ
jgi:thiamine-phosphate pyrophosphorylase